jgi:phosphomannomutase
MIGKVFKAYDVRAVYPDPLNEHAGKCIGYGVGKYLQDEYGKTGTVVVSRDMRPAAPSMAEALIEGLRATGMDVIDLGMCDTSIQYFAVPHLDALGGVQVTASHNPVEYIGFKVSKQHAKPVGADTGLKDIERLARSVDQTFPEVPDDQRGGYEERDLWPAYREHVLSFLQPLARPVNVFVDASNGMGTTLLEKVFSGIDNLNITAINDVYTTDWAHEPNPLVAENMVPTQQGVKQHSSHLGACFDGDADRCMLVDDQGELIGCDHLTALLAGHFAKTDGSDTGTIVYDLRSSKVVEQTIRDLNYTPKRSRVGHVFMKAALRETEAVFGGELSGHFYFRDNNYADSGAITLAVVLSVLGQSDRSLSDIIAPYRKFPQSGELNFRNDDKDGVMAQLKADYAGDGCTVDELDGVTIDCLDAKGWWFNVRASNTEPLLRLNAEAKDRATLDKIVQEITPLLGEPDAGH